MTNKRIVVIDDDKVTLALAKDMLEEAGFEVLTAASGLEANQFIYGKQPPDLILLDVVMPFLSGDRKVGFLKEQEKSRDIPVVLMSTKSRGELEQLALSSGADGFITKPLNKKDLLLKLAKFL